jgi:hypothetical protein
VPAGGDVQPSFYWTWKLLSDGYSINDLQQVRQLELTTVYDHLIRAAETDLKIEPDWLLNQIEIESLETFVAANDGASISRLLEMIPPELTTQQLLFYWKYRSACSR